jgi:hypothetical protein
MRRASAHRRKKGSLLDKVTYGRSVASSCANRAAALRSHEYSESEVAGIMGEKARRMLGKAWIS